MQLRKTFTTFLAAVCLCAAVVSESSADISNAAVLFLRIAPGARPAGMGEAFVAIADDATATHWNPAGLGSYPLADSWKESRIPDNLKPIKALTALRKEGGSGYMAFDLWALTAKGVARFDNKEWHLGEVFSTRTDETVAGKVKAYFNISDETELAKIVKRVAVANNERNYQFLVWLRDTVMANTPADYNMHESMSKGFDSLLAAFDLCLVNWSRVRETQQQFSDGMKDSKLSEQELDKINFAVEKSRNRFIPEEFLIPYSAVLEGTPFDIAASLELLLVATTENIFAYDGRRWRPLQSANDSVQVGQVHTLFALDKHILVGTDNGLMTFSGAKLRPVEKSEQLPSGKVSAIGAHDINDIWIVLNNDLYHFNGTAWSNSRPYTAVLDDTPETLATKFSIYGTAAEKQIYLAKLEQVNQKVAEEKAQDLVEPDGSRKGLLELMEEMKQQDTSSSIEPASSDSIDTTANVPVTENMTVSESTDTNSIEDIAVNETPASEPFKIDPGDVISVPYLAEIKGRVNAIQVNFDDIWLGTEFGIVHFNGKKWEMPGYRDTVIASAATVSELVSSLVLSDTAKMEYFSVRVTSINDLSDGAIAAGAKIKVPHNPAAANINEMGRRESKMFFATTEGLIEYDGEKWRRSDLKGMDETNAIDIRSIDDELWVANEDKVVTKANGRMEMSTMYVKWLPELADDLYYVFFSVVAPKSGWGTFGISGTFISYGTFVRTASGPTPIGEFDSFDFAGAVSFGTALTDKMSGGISAKIIYSKLADQGAGAERGSGTSTAFAVDLGLLYHMTQRLTWGLAVTNLGPQMTYIDAAQADDLPRNLAFGFAYKLLQSDYYRLLVTAEMNKILVGVDDGLSQELKETIFNTGAEFMYANIFAIRAGYIYDQDGNIKNLTLGAGLTPIQNMRFDFSYIPSGSTSVLANTLRLSLSIAP